MSQQSALNFVSWPIYTPKDYLLTSTMKDKKPTSSIPPFQSLLFIVFNSFIIYPKQVTLKIPIIGGFPGGPVVKNLP